MNHPVLKLNNMNNYSIYYEKVFVKRKKKQQVFFIHTFIIEYPSERIGNNGSLILLPILYPSNTSSKDLTSTQLLSDSSNLSTSVVE